LIDPPSRLSISSSPISSTTGVRGYAELCDKDGNVMPENVEYAANHIYLNVVMVADWLRYVGIIEPSQEEIDYAKLIDSSGGFHFRWSTTGGGCSRLPSSTR
jgi:hypothetical protein